MKRIINNIRYSLGIGIFAFVSLGGSCYDKAFAQTAITPVSPQLIMPSDGDTVRTPRPSFTWRPTVSRNPPVYQWACVQVLEGQTPTAAMQSNPAWHSSGKLSMTVYTYPFFAPKLTPGLYAWQVYLLPSEGVKDAYSEIWTFVVPPVPPPPPPFKASIPYVTPRSDLKPVFTETFQNTLHLSLEGLPFAPPISYRILDSLHNVVLCAEAGCAAEREENDEGTTKRERKKRAKAKNRPFETGSFVAFDLGKAGLQGDDNLYRLELLGGGHIYTVLFRHWAPDAARHRNIEAKIRAFNEAVKDKDTTSDTSKPK